MNAVAGQRRAYQDERVIMVRSVVGIAFLMGARARRLRRADESAPVLQPCVVHGEQFAFGTAITECDKL